MNNLLKDKNMNKLIWLLILGGFAYGGYYLYENGYFDSFLESFDNTVTRTADFATDKAVKEANY